MSGEQSRSQYRILFVGQSFGFASELPLGPELELLPMKQGDFIVNRVGRKADGGAEAPAPRIEFEKHSVLGESACATFTSLP